MVVTEPESINGCDRARVKTDIECIWHVVTIRKGFVAIRVAA